MSNTTKRFLMAASGAGGATYLDDVFSTYLYKGTASSHTINNGIDLSGEGGMVWIKERDGSSYHNVYDTVRGASKYLEPNTNDDQDTSVTRLNLFNNNGFRLGGNSTVNGSNNDYASWSFRKAKGFFDIVTWSGNDTAGRQIPHNLGSVPGCIMVKKISGAENWEVYHRGIDGPAPQNYRLRLNTTDARLGTLWNNTAPTATHFTLSSANNVNGSGDTYIAYIFAGNINDSVHFDGSGDTIHSGLGNAFTHNTNDFTIECWVKFEDTADRGIYQHDTLTTQNWSNNPAVGHNGTNWVVYGAGGTNQFTGGGARTVGQWYHIAHVRHSGVTKLYVDGVEKISFADTFNYQNTRILIGGYYNSSYLMKGNVTNWRLVKGRALYTSNFTPPTTPLGKTYASDGTMDTFFLCCNTGDPAGYTIDDTGNGMSIKSGDPQQSSDVPSTFSESSALFGENGDQNIMKCGSYTGNGNGSNTSNFDGPKINLGWEPQWVLIKNADAGQNWNLFDSMRGIITDGNDQILYPSGSWGEDSLQFIDITSTGFNIRHTDASVNGSGNNMIYIAIRMSDGYVGKPASAGTDVFDIKVAQTGGSTPYYQGYGFAVDSIISKNPDGTGDFSIYQRLTGKGRLETNTTINEANNNNALWDYMNGFNAYTGNDGYYLSWGWKRHAGFDVVGWEGDGVAGRDIRHSLGKIPEMIWLKGRSNTDRWIVYHKGLNGGVNPWDYELRLNENVAESRWSNWYDTAPTSSTFRVDNTGVTNGSSQQYIAMLFASVDGISKVGYYDGSNSSQTITTGFQPRFLVIKVIDTNREWQVLDTVRGWGAGNDQRLFFDGSGPQANDENVGAPTSTGFTLDTVNSRWNSAGSKYIYYAHA